MPKASAGNTAASEMTDALTVDSAPRSIARKKRIGPVSDGKPASQPATFGPQRRPAKEMTARKAGTRSSLSASNRLLQLDLDKHEFVRVGIDDVVLDPHFARIGLAGRELGDDFALGRLLHQLAGGQHHHHVVVRVAVPAGFRARREAPLRDEGAGGLLQQAGGRLGPLLRPPAQRASRSSSGTKSHSPMPCSTRKVADASPPLATRWARRGGTR